MVEIFNSKKIFLFLKMRLVKVAQHCSWFSNSQAYLKQPGGSRRRLWMESSCTEWAALPLDAPLAVTAVALCYSQRRGGIKDFFFLRKKMSPYSPQRYIFYIWSVKHICKRCWSEIILTPFRATSQLLLKLASAHCCPPQPRSWQITLLHVSTT